jgi:signal recognition particle GTPase
LTKVWKKPNSLFFPNLRALLLASLLSMMLFWMILEEILITSDVGVETTLKIIKRIEERVANDKYVSTNELNAILKDEIVQLLAENNTT